MLTYPATSKYSWFWRGKKIHSSFIFKYCTTEIQITSQILTVHCLFISLTFQLSHNTNCILNQFLCHGLPILVMLTSVTRTIATAHTDTRKVTECFQLQIKTCITSALNHLPPLAHTIRLHLGDFSSSNQLLCQRLCKLPRSEMQSNTNSTSLDFFLLCTHGMSM